MFDGIHDLGLFIAAGLLLNLTPGADMALVASRSAGQGFKAGAAAALGVGAGCWVHTAAAALGLSAIAAGSPAAYTALRWVGAAYLVWLGVGLLRTRAAGATPAGAANGRVSTAPSDPPTIPLPWRRFFGQGFLTNALNPKVALFFLAFVPQFIDSGAPHKALAFIVLGTVFVVNSTLVNLALAWAVAALKRRLGQHGNTVRLGLWLNRGAGVLFVALGAKLAIDSGR